MTCCRIALCLIAVASLARAREPQAPAETIRELAEYMKRHQQFEARRARALVKPRLKASVAQKKGGALRRPYDPKQMESLKGRLKSYEGGVALAEKRLAAARIKNPKERAAKLEEAEIKVAAAEKAVQALLTPLNEEYDRIQQDSEPVQQKLVELAELVPRNPTEHGVASSMVRTRAGGGSIMVTWQDDKKHTLAQLHVQLIGPQARPQRTTELKLAGKYPVRHVSDYAVDFSVGSRSATFSAINRKWRNKEKLPKLAEALIDFEALEGMDVALAGDEDLRKQVSEFTAKRKEWQSRMQSTTREAQLRQSAVRQERSALREPYDSSRVAQQERALATQQQSLAGVQAELSVAGIKEPAKRKAAQLKAAEAAKQAQQDVVEAGMPLRAEQVALAKAERVASFDLWQLVDGAVRMPKDLGAVPPEVDASAKSGSASVSYRDARMRQLVWANLRFLPGRQAMPAKDKVAGKYPVQVRGRSSITFQVGSVKVSLNVQKTEWQSKEKVLELATKLLDLDAIAAWPKIGDVE